MRKTMKREYDFRNAKRGPVVSVRGGKTRITIRIDDQVLAWFRDQVEQAGGGNYQTLLNEVLRQHVQNAQEPLEKTLRRVIREELRRASQGKRIALQVGERSSRRKCTLARQGWAELLFPANSS